MIGAVLTDLGPRVTHADLVRVRDETLSVTIGENGDGLVTAESDDLLQIRLGTDGRLGWAAGSSATVDAVTEAAFRSATSADAATLPLPAPSPLPEVVTRSPGSAALSSRALVDLASRLRDRLARKNRQVVAWSERSVGTVEVGNTRGVLATYDVTVAGVGAEVRADGDGPTCRVHRAAIAPPEPADLEAIVREVEARLGPPLLEHGPLPATGRIWFAPRAVRALLTPLLARLIGERWLDSRERWPALDTRLTLVDDPLAAGRPGSRPLSDDGVPSRRIALIERGVPKAGIIDLAVGARHRIPATGHEWRRGFAAARAGFTNLRLAGGDVSPAGLSRALGDGYLVSDLSFGPAPNPASGVFRVAVPWMYRVAAGEVQGRVDGGVVMGDVFELLGQVVAIGADAEWIGAAEMPSLVIDGVGLAAR